MINRMGELQNAVAALDGTADQPSTPKTPNTLQRLLSRGRLSPASPLPPQDSNSAQDSSLQRFLRQLEDIKREPLRELDGHLQEARNLHSQALNATTARSERDAVARAESCAERASAAASRTCRSLQALSSEASSGRDSEASVKRQAFAGVSALFQKKVTSLFQAQQAFRMEMEAKVSRQFRAAFPEADDEAVAAIVQGQRSAASTIQDTVTSSPGSAPLNPATALQMSREHCDELVRLERAAHELQKAFLDVESLVESQGEAIDDIARHMEDTRNRTETARDQLEEASRSRRAYIRCRMSLACVCLVLLFCVIIIIWNFH